MNKYETIMIINKDKIEEKDTILSNLTKLMNNPEVEEWGLKRLAYPIKEQKEGYYILVNFEQEVEAIKTIEKFYETQEAILKFIILKKD